MENELTIEDKAVVINLALQITLGKVNLQEVLKEIKRNPFEWERILNFWAVCSNDTRKAIEYLHSELNYLGAENI